MTDAIDGFIEAERRAGWWTKARDHEGLKRHGNGIRELIYETTKAALDAELTEIEPRLDKGWTMMDSPCPPEWEREWMRLIRRYEVLFELRRHMDMRLDAGLPVVRRVVQPVIEHVTPQPIAAEQIEMFGS